MKTIISGSLTFLTSSNVGDAVLEYSNALARRECIEIVDIPIRTADDRDDRARFTVGWMFNIAVLTSNDDSIGELADGDAVHLMTAATHSLQSRGRCEAVRGRTLVDDWSDYDLVDLAS